MTREPAARPPFSYRIRVGHVSHNPLEVRLEADARERAALAEMWGIIGVEELVAALKIRRWKKDGIKVTGEVRAHVTQACVVTLDPVAQDIEEDIEEVFVPEGSPLARIPANDAGEIVLDPEGPDLPEPFTGDEIDAGALVAEVVAMSLDPYPRKPDAAFDAHVEADDKDEGKPSPFAVLKNLKLEK